MMMISGFRSLPLGAARQSVTIFWLMPVASSISSRTEKPAVRSTNFATPAFSAMIGSVYGSHSASFWPRTTLAPSLARILVP